jgi:4-aminobutyrate---pyruvate transaminase
MPPMPNSTAARDIAYYVHPQTSLRRHHECGPVIIDRGDGAIVYDDSGKRYIETVAGLWCASLGFSASERIAQVAYDAFAPPFVITQAEIDEMLASFARTLDAAHRELAA